MLCMFQYALHRINRDWYPPVGIAAGCDLRLGLKNSLAVAVAVVSDLLAVGDE